MTSGLLNSHSATILTASYVLISFINMFYHEIRSERFNLRIDLEG